MFSEIYNKEKQDYPHFHSHLWKQRRANRVETLGLFVPFVVEEVQFFSQCVAIFTVFIMNIASNHSNKGGII
jgi:hypothetical protein